MSVETTSLESGSTSWHAGLTRKHWRILTGSYLGWLFDGYETFALVLVLQAALATLLTAEQTANFPIYAGLVIGITLLGWGLGGLAGGVLAGAVVLLAVLEGQVDVEREVLGDPAVPVQQHLERLVDRQLHGVVVHTRTGIVLAPIVCAVTFVLRRSFVLCRMVRSLQYSYLDTRLA